MKYVSLPKYRIPKPKPMKAELMNKWVTSEK
jgi:hypothetical protein